MNLLHITPSFYPATYWGGPIYSVYGLCNALAKIPGVSLRVLTTDAAGPGRFDSVKVTDSPMRYPAGYEVFFCRRRWASSVSPGMLLRLWPMIRRADVVHLTAVYSFPTIPTLLICRLLGKPVVWSPRGALQRWEGATKPLAKRAWERICNALVKPGMCIMHVTSEKEAFDSKARIPKAAVDLIPNGVEFPKTLADRSWLPDGRLRLLYLGRLHAIKGIENLLRAIKIIVNENVSLTICGNGDEAYTRSLRQMVHNLGLESQIKFQGHVAGDKKLLAFMQADICVVPSYSENFGMVVVEALAHGLPVIASKGTPWPEIERRGCGLWVDNDPASLAASLVQIGSMPLSDMGERGKVWMKELFGWDSIAHKMHSVYCELINRPKTMNS